MMESVAVRQRGAYDFETHYNNLCALQGSCPSPAVKAHLTDGVLDINGDRIRVADWVPILNSVSINKTLTFIAIRSYFSKAQEDDDKRVGVHKKTPPIRFKDLTYRLCRSLKDCLTVTPALTCIELQGLPLRERDLSSLAKGLTCNSTLSHLSLEYSTIGDNGLEVICQGIKNSPSVTSLNFTGCGLTWKGAGVLATVIKHQAMKRHNEAWQDSLRYRRPDLDRMSGIRRITINCNALVGEKGAKALAEALKDDLWLKALDMQQCGVSNSGAQALLDVLKYNTTIVVLDVRQNPLIDQDIIRSIMEQVMINCNGQDTEYKWIRTVAHGGTPAKAAGRVKKKRTRTLQNSFGKKTTIKVSTNSPRRWSKSGSQVSRSEGVRPGPGMPWRTALRADRYRGHSGGQDPGQPNLFANLSSGSSPGSPLHTSVHVDYTDDADETTETVDDGDPNESTYAATKKVMVELEQLRRRFREESIARSRADAKVLELQVENQRLRHQVEKLQAGGATSSSLLDDDRVISTIEKSFQQFHAFLDLLQDAGLGQLISLAGLDASRTPLNRSDLEAVRATSRSGPGSQGAPPASKPERGPSPQGGDTGRPSDGAPLAKGGKFTLVADNQRHGDDPTVAGPVGTSPTGGATFDELYAKVLRETDGAISSARAESLANGGGHSNVQDLSEMPAARPASAAPTEKSAVDSEGDRTDRSHPSHKSRSRHSDRSGPRPLQRHNNNQSEPGGRGGGGPGGKESGGRSAGSLKPTSVSSLYSNEHDYSQDFEKTQSDISEDIENIQDIQELLPAPNTSGFGDDF